ncbi:MAG: pyridoxal phosphate-dependent aminotransferase, partial [Cytophagales bacterium]|nr:pyridoxal phosphate-dependent aminotransferase [Cytophagales bacterium]
MATLTELKRLSDRINALEESATIGMAKKARELSSKGVAVVNLSFGEPDFQTPQHIKDAAKKAIDDGFTFYTPVPGYPELRTAVVNKLKRDNGLDYKPENIVVSTGAKQSIANVLLCLLDEGDEVVIYSPYWVSYSELVKLAGGKAVLIEGTLENDFKASIQQLRNAITDRTKVVMFSSPCNPTGSVFSEKELKEIAEEVMKHENLYVIADEIYEFINFGEKHVSIASFPGMIERTALVNGMSKGFAMTGWRLGYMAAPKWLADACDKLQGQVTSATSSISQKAAVAGLNGDMAPTVEMNKAFLRRRDLVHGLLKEIPGVKTNLPKGAFYFFPEISYYFGKTDGTTTINDAMDLCMYILNEAHVSTVPGD